MLGHAENIVITMVFISFHFSEFCIIWVSPGRLWDLIFDTFGVPLGTILVFLGDPGDWLDFQ